MKIIIIGAGLSGLTTALALQKYLPPQLPANESLEIKVYDESQTKPSKGIVEYGWRDHSDIHQQQKEEKENFKLTVSSLSEERRMTRKRL